MGVFCTRSKIDFNLLIRQQNQRLRVAIKRFTYMLKCVIVELRLSALECICFALKDVEADNEP